LDGTALVAAILYGNATPLRQRNPTLPPALEGAIEKAMAGRPGDRFASVAEFAVALREALTPSSNTPSATAATATGQPVLAVLEFENVSGDPASDWLGTGLAETLNADLRKLKLVRVVSRERAQEALRRRGTARQVANLADIGRELGARWLITGSFQRSGQRLRITPRVIDTATAEVLASRKIDGDWENIFELQDRVVSDVMDALEVKVELSARERIAAPETRLLEAFELYARGRKVLNELGKNSLEEARECFEKAIALDSHYQVAFSGLGATYAMRYSHRTDPDDLTRATSYLERALELDPELAEPYPYLCYAYMRQGKVEQAIAAGHKGIEYQPDFGQAHYFLGTAYIVGGELDPQYLFSAVKTLLRAGAVERRWVPTWMCLGGLALNYGAYDHAERFLKQFLDIERSGTAMGRFVGAETLLGTISLRRGDRRRAREWFELSRDRLVASDHMYRESLLALNACGLGDLVLREGDITAAQAEYRRAINTAKEFPRTLGHLRVLTRATCGLASAYAAAGERSRAEVLVRTAAEHLESIHTQPQTWVLEGGESVLHYGRGVALARLGELQPALEELSTAVARGWHDAAWTETDPEMAPLADLPRFRELVESLRGTLQPLFEP
jgi:TolB-like protein/Tfp pilus assembly protein PilF